MVGGLDGIAYFGHATVACCRDRGWCLNWGQSHCGCEERDEKDVRA